MKNHNAIVPDSILCTTVMILFKFFQTFYRRFGFQNQNRFSLQCLQNFQLPDKTS